MVIRVNTYDMNLCVSPDWNLGGKSQPYLAGENPVPVDIEQDDTGNV